MENTKKDFIAKVAAVQLELKAPKSQWNKFGNYAFRNCEDILEAAKPLLCEKGLLLTLSDDIINIADRFYVKVTATITDGNNSVFNTALARESFDRKGMDDSQITGTASSYARKYALNGLLMIDDTKDDDSTNTHPKEFKDDKNSNVKTAQKSSVVTDSKSFAEGLGIQENKKTFIAACEDTRGAAYSGKDQLKALGFKFNQDLKTWFLIDAPMPKTKIDGISFEEVDEETIKISLKAAKGSK